MSDTLRLFVALEPDSGVQKQAAKEFARFGFGSEVKPTDKEQLHSTLKFWSHFPLQDLAQLLQALEDVAQRHPVLTLDFNQPVIFGGQQARVLALEAEKNEELIDLYNDLEETLVEYGLADREGRLFRPHLTLARIKDYFTEEDRQKFESWKPDITAVHEDLKLYSSILTPKGPEYDQLASFSLLSEE